MIGTEGIISWLRHLKEWKAARILKLLEYHYLLTGELVEYESDSGQSPRYHELPSIGPFDVEGE